MARKKKHLVIVESPAKAKTINKYLGPGYDVVASLGHVRDLPKSRFGIDIEGGWVPTYRDLKDRKDVLAGLKKAAAGADMVYLAPDPDREGEAIAWHLKEALNLKDERIQRVTFNEITKSAVQKAFANARQIDMDLVAAQEARRFLDRIVGYKLSPLLSLTLAEKLTAGRVQSVAVRLIVEREREIAAFKPEEYWKIGAVLQTRELTKAAVAKGAKPKKVAKPKPKEEDEEELDDEAEKVEKQEEQLPEGAFIAELSDWDGKKFKASSQAEVDPIVAALKGADYTVTKVEQKDRQEKPQAPFTTSTLQQQASLRLRFTAKRTMGVAQRLYQGVQLGSEGQVALITYMRTDSTRISDEALKNVRTLIKDEYGDKYLPDKANTYASSKDAQGAHEAIRPTDLEQTPAKVAKHLKAEELKLYTLIYNRFVACQMTPAVFAVTNVEVTAAKGTFKAQGKTLKFDGYRKVYVQSSKQEDVILPTMRETDPLTLLNLKPTQHFTEPPPRYNEASLVKTLEKEGIGRPSTYASIINKIQDEDRGGGYVQLKERRFYATPIGMKVTDLLVEHFPKVMDLHFTRQMEEELDHIEDTTEHSKGRAEPADERFRGDWLQKSPVEKRNVVLADFYGPFSEAIQVAETEMLKNAEKCPLCGLPLEERFSKFGKFFGCSGYKNEPKCTYIKKKAVEGLAPGEKAGPATDADGNLIKCPTCGKDMIKRAGKTGPFLGCSGYPDCKTTMNFDAEGKAVVTSQPTEHVCEKCGAPMVQRMGKRGPFLGCSAYPKCKNIVELDAEGKPVKPIDTGIKCEKCDSPMIVKRSFRGPFLGCSAYPSCRSTKQLPPELKEKLAKEAPAMPAKAKSVAVDAPADIKCPECDGPMKLRPGRWGKYFFGCNKYPKCKGTMKATQEQTDQIMGAAAGA